VRVVLFLFLLWLELWRQSFVVFLIGIGRELTQGDL